MHVALCQGLLLGAAVALPTFLIPASDYTRIAGGLEVGPVVSGWLGGVDLQ